jgi:hypothetical protein
MPSVEPYPREALGYLYPETYQSISSNSGTVEIKFYRGIMSTMTYVYVFDSIAECVASLYGEHWHYRRILNIDYKEVVYGANDLSEPFRILIEYDSSQIYKKQFGEEYYAKRK